MTSWSERVKSHPLCQQSRVLAARRASHPPAGGSRGAVVPCGPSALIFLFPPCSSLPLSRCFLPEFSLTKFPSLSSTALSLFQSSLFPAVLPRISGGPGDCLRASRMALLHTVPLCSPEALSALRGPENPPHPGISRPSELGTAWS